MSMRALLMAVRDNLKTAPTTGLGYTDANCAVTLDGQPFEMADEFFVAVSPDSWTNQYDEGLEEEFGVSITVSVRVPRVPADRIGKILMADGDGVYKSITQLVETIRAHIHSNYVIMNAANTILTGAVNGFHRPLFLRDGGRPMKKPGSWFGSGNKDQFAGLAQTIRFGGATRTQTIESMD